MKQIRRLISRGGVLLVCLIASFAMRSATALAAEPAVFEIESNDDLRAAITEIKQKRDVEGLTEATIVFTQDIAFDYDRQPGSGWESGSDMDARHVGKNYFSGVEGVTLTLKSPEGAEPSTVKNLGATWGSTRLANAGFSTKNGETARCFTGPMVLDNIVLDPVRDDVYYFAQGNVFETTTRFSMTRKAHLYGGTMGRYVRQDGMGFGDKDGVRNDDSILGWREPDGGVESTRLVLRGGEYSSVVGGGYNGEVKNGTSVSVELSDDVPWTARDANCGYIYGGGVSNGAKSEGAANATVAGDIHVEALSGVFGEIYGGSHKGIVRGDVYVTVGQKSSESLAVYTDVFGGSYMGQVGQKYGSDWVGGDILVTIRDTSRGSDYIAPDMTVDGTLATVHGAGMIDIVNGTVEIVLEGGANNYQVFAGGTNVGAHDQSCKIQNTGDEAVAASIRINGGEWGEVYSAVETNYSSTAEQLIAGDVHVELNGGSANYFGLSAHQTHVEGDSALAINGGDIGDAKPGVCGYQHARHSGNAIEVGKVDGKRKVEIKNANPMHCYGIYAVDEVVVDNTAPFFIEPYAAKAALLSCGDLDIKSGIIVLRGTSSLVDTAKINGRLKDGASKGSGDLSIAEGAVLALNGANALEGNGLIEAAGSARGAGRLLVVEPYGEWRAQREVRFQMPSEGEVYIRSKKTEETAASGSRATLVTLQNSPTSLYVEYTTDDVTTGVDYGHAWRIATDPDARIVTVSYDVNGGDLATKPADQIVVIPGGQTSGRIDKLPTPPTWIDHEFTGWNMRSDGTGGHFTEQTDVASDLTVYAQWKETVQKFTVTYQDGVEGEEVFADKTFSGISEGAATPLFGEDPVRNGYVFDGWRPEIAPVVTEDVVYTAKWVVKTDPPVETFTVRYTDGVVDEEVFADKVFTNLKKGDSTPLFGDNPVRAGFVFGGWEPEVSESVTDDAVYTAKWTKLVPPTSAYTVTYTDGVDGEEVFADQIYSDLAEGMPTPAFQGTPTRSGYEFTGWVPEVAPTVTRDVTYSATWQEIVTPPPVKKYTVIYTDGVDGEEVFADRVHSGLSKGDATPAFGKDPVRAGYLFTGWNPKVSPTVTADAVYAATWKVDDSGEPPVGPDDPDKPVDPEPNPGPNPSPDPDPSPNPGQDDNSDSGNGSGQESVPGLPATGDTALLVTIAVGMVAVVCILLGCAALARRKSER